MIIVEPEQRKVEILDEAERDLTDGPAEEVAGDMRRRRVATAAQGAPAYKAEGSRRGVQWFTPNNHRAILTRIHVATHPNNVS